LKNLGISTFYKKDLKIKIPNDRKAMNENIPKEIHAAGT